VKRAALLIVAWFATPACADDALKQAMALESTVQQVVERGEGSVACVLVSRSDAYAKYPQWNEVKRGVPGKLGRFRSPPDGNPMRLNPEQDGARRLDLALPRAVPDSYGSGVVLDAAEALVLTNFHVVKDATKVFVRLPGRSGSYADIHAADERSDLAVLKLLDPPGNLKPLTMGDGDALKKGQFLLAISNPFAAGFRDGSPSVSWGMLSNIRRRVPGEPNLGEQKRPRLHYYPVLLQTSIRMAAGSSGGALFDLKGNWIGLTTAIPGVVGGDESGGYAVPLDIQMKRIIEKLRKGEEVEYGFLGISQTRPGFGGDGRWIPSNGGPAARAGMRDNDKIVSIDGHPIVEADDMLFSIGVALAGTRVKMVVERFGERIELFPVLVKANWPSTSPVIAANRPAPVHGLRVDYTSVMMMGAGRDPIPFGVIVREVDDDSPAAKADLKANRDVIVAVNGRTIQTPREFYDAVREANGDIELTLAESGRRVRIP